MKKLILLLMVCFCQPVLADQITFPTIWSVNDTVTNVKLNNDNNAVSAVVNGALDNTNMKIGYSLFQTVSSLPAAGTQGRVDFLTSDNSLNLDTGAAWIKTITPSGTAATGNIPYYNGGWQQLTPGAQYLPIVSNGTSSLPSYQVLPVNGGGTGQNFSAGTSGNVLYFSSTGVVGSKLQTFVPNNIQVFTSNGTWTKPSTVSSVYVKVWGAGAGGGEGNGANTRCGGGGGPGGYSEGLTAVTGNVTVTVGTGGTGGGGGIAATDGTLSSFAGTTTLTANGGTKGSSDAANSAGGVGGSASNGTINITGSTGGDCGAIGTTASLGGMGGASPMGGAGGAGGLGLTGGANGIQGASPGGGGGGGGRNNGTDATGGNGANGMVIVYY